jgi:hypothetical protein
LAHIIHKYTAAGRRAPRYLYTCFVDFAKAFDTVDRPKLWQRLAQLGIQGKMLASIKAYYADTTEQVRTNEGLSPPIPSHMGVKQGCPLSPTLFGLIIDESEDWLLHMVPDSSVHVGPKRTPILLYADDLVLLATSEDELQALLDTLGRFCDDKLLTVGLQKTQAVVFCSPRHPAQPEISVSYKGSPIAQVPEYKYLGVVFHWNEGASRGGALLIAAAERTSMAIMQRAWSLHLRSSTVLCDLFRSLVLPILTYCCEVWGSNKRLQDKADNTLYTFLRRVFRVPVHTEKTSLLAEAGMAAPSDIFSQRMARYWDRLTSVDDDDRLLAHAAAENMEWLSQNRRNHKRCWGQHILHRLQRMGAPVHRPWPPLTPPTAHIMDHLDDLPLQAVHRTLTQALEQGANDHRDLYGHVSYSRTPGDRKRTYARLFWTPEGRGTVQNCFLQHTLTSFRLGNHGLAINAPTRHATERRLLRCSHCSLGVIEDETHMLLECPLYNHVRDRYMPIFVEAGIAQPNPTSPSPCLYIQGDATVRSLMQVQQQEGLARFIRACLLKRREACL